MFVEILAPTNAQEEAAGHHCGTRRRSVRNNRGVHSYQWARYARS
jgi:hypothetical protein